MSFVDNFMWPLTSAHQLTSHIHHGHSFLALFQLVRSDRSVIEGLHDIVSLLEDQLKPLVEAESSVLVDILYRPECLFHQDSEVRKKCEKEGFIGR